MLSSKYLINILVCLMWYSQCKKSENQAARFQFYIVFPMLTKPDMSCALLSIMVWSNEVYICI
jgi:hypothetical protein